MMSSGTPAKLPVIDFSNQNLKPGSPEWDSVKHQVREALKEYGCFEASLDQLLELRDAVFAAMEEAFDLPSETKKLYVSDKHFRGYFDYPSGSLESMTIDEARVAENIEQRLTTTLWPQGNISFSKTLVLFTELASRLEKTVKRMILEIFGVEQYEDELIDNTNYMLKLLKYKSPQTSEPTAGALAHTDKSMVTLLHQNEVDGLEIQNKDGEWINAKHSPNSFIVMVGESLQIWLNDGLSPTFHRVMMKGDKARYSVGLFASPRGGYQVKAPEELVDNKNPMLFKPFDFEEFLRFYSTQVAPGGDRTGLSAYCKA
ncbi:gibberellin 20 oxidase 1 [Hibiscus syriacus]|uniref:Gibberellin 20 oxidase 1 n=1 Tax=Hibiscus syriacus TaxID=106335 RepID=A0A6A2YNG6_HIBSY|nr:probable 2-oxoglutarate-dependent dioxygenase AOP1 [Hibiscus syriacus]KAE8680886.1 gibberellin 20 oxidase 1 [Hibiscus syriacus]